MRNLKSVLAALAMVLPAASFADWNTQYTINRDNADYSIDNILLYERSQFGGSTTWAFGVPYGETSHMLENPFPTTNLPEQSFMIGLAHDLPGDAEGQEHVVLMMDDEAASLSNHIAWGTLFRNTLEDQLIANIKLATSGQDWPIITPGLDAIGDFIDGDGSNGILDNLAQPHPVWFNFGGTFTVMAFSDGQILGTGVTSTRYTPPVPEPASFAVVGLGIAGVLRRRRRS